MDWASNIDIPKAEQVPEKRKTFFLQTKNRVLICTVISILHITVNFSENEAKSRINKNVDQQTDAGISMDGASQNEEVLRKMVTETIILKIGKRQLKFHNEEGRLRKNKPHGSYKRR